MAFIRTWRYIVSKTRESKATFAAFGILCVAIPWGLAKITQNATTPMSEEDVSRRRNELRGGRMDGQVMARVNKERLGQLLSEIKDGNNTNDRYSAALKGETLTGTPESRIRGGGGTSIDSKS